ncbi:MAG: kelch repeat-containing protein, partial [Acidobacteriota bacterium]
LALFTAFQLADPWAANSTLAAGKAPAVQSPERMSLNVARRGHTMTALPDGRVVIIGGENESGAIAEAEILDSAASSLTVAARSLAARSRHSATLLGDGRVLVVGGTAQSKLLNSTEWFDPATGEFSAGPRLNRARAGHTATELGDGRLLVTGGNAEGSVEILTPGAGRFTLLSAKLDAKPSFHAAALLADGNVLLAGGVAQDGRWLRSAEIFDPSSISSEPVAEKMWIKRVQPAMRLLPDGKVQVIGGDYDGTMEV